MAASSPCINICQMDDDSDLCLGCGRTIDEIIAWGSLREDQRQAIMADLPARLEELTRKGAR